MIRTLNGLGGNDTTTNVYVNTAFASGEATEVEQQSNTTQAKVNLAFKSNTTQATSVNNNDLILIADNATGKIVKYVEANLVGQTLTATLPLVISNDVISTNFTKSSTDTLTNKTITSFTGGNSASITTPSNNGTLALTSDIPNLTATSPITYETSTGTIATTFTPTSTTSMSGKTFTDSVSFTNGEITIKSTTATSTSNARINFQDSNNANIGSVGNFLGDFYVSSVISGKDLRLSANAGKIKFDNTDTEFKASGTNNFNSGVITNLSTLNTHSIPSGTGTFALTSQIIDPITSINFGTNTATTGTRTLGLSTENTNINGDTITIQGQTATNLRSTNAVNINGNALVIKAETSAGVIFDPATSGTYHGIDVKDNALKNSLLNGKIKFNSDLDVISKDIHIRTNVDTANLKNAKIFFNSTNGSLEYAKMGLFNDNFQILQTIPEKDLILSNQSSSNTLPSGSIRIDGDLKCEKRLYFRDQPNAVDKSQLFMDGDNLKIQTINTGNTEIQILPAGGAGKVVLGGNTEFKLSGSNDFNSGSITNLASIEGGLNLKNGNTSAGFIDFFERSLSGTNKITLKPHTDTIASDYTITLPNSGGQMILNNTTDTFSNKSFSDVINFVISTTNTASVGLNGSNLRLQALTGNSDIQLVASGNGKISFTGNTEFFQASNVNVNSSNLTNVASINTHTLPQGTSELVDRTSTQTLTNKSISYSQLTGTPLIPTNTNQLTNGANFISANSTDTLTNKTITSFTGVNSATITTPSTNGTLALTSEIPDGFTISGNTPNKEATAPVCNDYIFSSGDGSKGNCRLIIKSDTDNSSSEDANCQVLFSKENDAVQGSIGMGTPSSSTNDNSLILNSNYTGEGIIFKTQGTERLKITPTTIQPSEPFKGLQVQNSTTSGGQIEFLEGTDNGTNKITLKAPNLISADATLTLPTTAGTLGLEANAFAITGSFQTQNKVATAPSCNDYLFTSGGNANGSCRLIIRSDDDNAGDETKNCQILFTKENNAVQASIGLGIPASTTDQDDLILNSNFTTKGIVFKTQGTERLKISPTKIHATTSFLPFQVFNETTSGGFIDFFEKTSNGNHKIRIQVPDAVGANATLFLPTTAGNLALTSDIPNLTGTTPITFDTTTGTIATTFTPTSTTSMSGKTFTDSVSFTNGEIIIKSTTSTSTSNAHINFHNSSGTPIGFVGNSAGDFKILGAISGKDLVLGGNPFGNGKIQLVENTQFKSSGTNDFNSGAITNLSTINTHTIPSGTSALLTADSVNNLENKDFIDTPEFKNGEIKIRATTDNANFLDCRVMFHQQDDTQIGDIGHSNGHLEVKNLVSNKDIEIDTTGTGKIRLEALTQCERALKVSNGIFSAGYIELFENSTNGSSAIKLSAPESIATPITETKQTLQDFNGTIALVEKNGFTPITSPLTGLEAPTSGFFNFTSGAGANGDCIFRLDANTDNANTNATSQMIFRRKNVNRGIIGIGTPNTSFPDDFQITASQTTGKIVISNGVNLLAYFSTTETYINKTLKAKAGIETSNASNSAGYVDFFENVSNGTNKVRIIAPESVASDKTLTLPDNTGTIATIDQNAFTISGNTPNKEATAPICNDYIFSSGAGGNGSCRVIIKSDTDNGGNETDNCQVLFSKESDAVQGWIGMGQPGSTTDQNDMNINSHFSGSSIFLKTQNTTRLQIKPDEVVVPKIIPFTAGGGTGSSGASPISIGNYLSGYNNSSGNSIYNVIYSENQYIYFNVSAFAGGSVNGGSYAGYVDYLGFQDVSDKRLKEDIIYLDSSACLQQALELKPCSYKFKQQPEKPRGVGFIAQEVEQVVPEVVSQDGTGGLGMGYGHLTATLSGAVQELNKIIQQQNERIQNLENIINTLTSAGSFATFKKNLT